MEKVLICMECCPANSLEIHRHPNSYEVLSVELSEEEVPNIANDMDKKGSIFPGSCSSLAC